VLAAAALAGAAVGLAEPDPDTPRFPRELRDRGRVTVWRNDGGRFTDIAEAAGIRLSGWTFDFGYSSSCDCTSRSISRRLITPPEPLDLLRIP
jgi:hypothetical protein